MKIKPTKKSSKKYLYITLGVAVAIGIVAATYVYAFDGNLLGWKKSYNNSSINYDKPTDEQKQAGNDAKRETVERDAQQQEHKPSASQTDQTPVPTPQQSGKSKVEVSITAANQNGSIFQVRSVLFTLANSGTCTLTLTKGTATVIKTAKVQAQATSSACLGFDIPTSELSPGVWHLTINFENETVTGTAEKDITII